MCHMFLWSHISRGIGPIQPTPRVSLPLLVNHCSSPWALFRHLAQPLISLYAPPWTSFHIVAVLHFVTPWIYTVKVISSVSHIGQIISPFAVISTCPYVLVECFAHLSAHTVLSALPHKVRSVGSSSLRWGSVTNRPSM